MKCRLYQAAHDYEAVSDLFLSVIATGDTYVFAPTDDSLYCQTAWIDPAQEVWVLELSGIIVGTYVLKPNYPGLGSHIANASFMVSPSAIGQGFGRLMGEHALKRATQLGFQAMQFNCVVSTNEAAVRLWKKLGFSIIGTVPQGFKHATKGFVDTHIMHKGLNEKE